MFSTILSVLGALLVLSVLVTVHELGHYLAGRKLGFTILEFSVGMGPVILKKERKEIQYSLRALPIGGMCRFYGEDQEVADGRCFNAQPAWKRFITIIAGPIMNLLFAIIFAVISLVAYGDYVPSIVELSGTDSPAYIGGLQSGDVLYAVNGERIEYYNGTVPMILAAPNDTMVITVERDGKRTDCTLTDFYNAEQQKNIIGITIQPVRKMFGFFPAIGQSFTYVGSTVKEAFSFFGRLFQGNVQSTDVAGPAGIITYLSEAVRSSFENVLRLSVLISISLGIMNLLPLPALDGGRLVFILIEWVRGKPVNPKVEGAVHFAGLLLLFALLIFLTYNDIANLIRG